MVHLDKLMNFKDLDAESGTWILDVGFKNVKSRAKFLEQVPFDDYILLTTGPNSTILAWQVCLMIDMQLTGSNA